MRKGLSQNLIKQIMNGSTYAKAITRVTTRNIKENYRKIQSRPWPDLDMNYLEPPFNLRKLR